MSFNFFNFRKLGPLKIFLGGNAAKVAGFDVAVVA